jgi:hypothetical protein
MSYGKILYVMILFQCSSIGQSRSNCINATDIPSYKKELIKEVCIPDGYTIVLIHSKHKDIDINGDSLSDFIFEYRKQKFKEMDTTYLSAYRKVNDSTHVFLKTFNNILPLHLKSYDYPSGNAAAAKVFNCYGDGYPLKKLDIENGVISLSIRIDAASGYLLKYSYEKERRNWYLTTFQEWIDMPDGSRQSSDRNIRESGESIDEFSYQKYLCPELFPGGQDRSKKEKR